MAPKDGRGHIKPAPDFALCEAMHVLCQVVRQPPPLVPIPVPVPVPVPVRAACALHERRSGNNPKAQQERTHERRDQRRGGAHPRLVHRADGHARGQEAGELRERGRRGRQGTRFELFPL